MDLQEALNIMVLMKPSEIRFKAESVVIKFVQDYLAHRIPLRVSPHQLGEFAMEWLIQDKEGHTMLPAIPNCKNQNLLFRGLNIKEPTMYWSYQIKLTEEERKEMR